jgi:hypothetical protein
LNSGIDLSRKEPELLKQYHSAQGRKEKTIPGERNTETKQYFSGKHPAAVVEDSHGTSSLVSRPSI